MVWEGAGVVKSARKLIGATNPLEAEPGTIRGDFAVQARRLALPRLVTPPRLGCWSEGWDVATSVGGCEFPGCRLCHFLHPHPPMPFPAQVGRNVVHGSDSPENGERETGGWGWGGGGGPEWGGVPSDCCLQPAHPRSLPRVCHCCCSAVVWQGWHGVLGPGAESLVD